MHNTRRDPKGGAESYDTDARAIRVAHLVSHPVQYFAPLYRELARRPEIDLTVFYYSDFSVRGFADQDFGRVIAWDTPLTGGFKHTFLPSSVGRTAEWLRARPNWDLQRELLKGQFDAVWAMSYASTNAVVARGVAAVLGLPFLVRDDTTLQTPRAGWRRALKAPLLKTLLSGAWAMHVGASNREYWLHYGIPPQRLFFSPHCVNNEYFSGQANDLRSQRFAIRQRFGISDDAPVVLFCGKLIAKKEPLLLLEAFAQVRSQLPCWLLIAGDGPLRGQLEKEIQSRGIPGVLLPGFLNQSEVSLAYAASDMLVLPSSRWETWGLVVNEAMNFRLPVIVSERVGCARDLVIDGENGFVFANCDVDALSAAIFQLVMDEKRREKFGARSREIVSRYDLKACADGIVNALVASRRRKG